MSTLPDRVAVASRAVARVLRDLELETGAQVRGLALEELERVGDPRKPGLLLSVRIELAARPAREWEVG